MIEQTYRVKMVKLAQRALRENVIVKNRDGMLKGANNRSLAVAGWSIEEDLDQPRDWDSTDDRAHEGWRQYGEVGSYRFEMYLKVVYSVKSEKEPDKNVLRAILKSLNTKAAQPIAGQWSLDSVDGEEYEVPDDSAIPLSSDFVGYTEINIPDNFERNFDHLYGLDSQIKRIKRAIEAGHMSDWVHRLHCGLIGPPGCGKSDICRTLKRIFGEEAVLEFDATATTGAGAIKELAEREILPRLLIIEEIEKADDKALDFLLAALDLRAEIRKTTARATIQRDTKLFAIATVNNVELFRKLKAGALASRFSNQIFFRRPNRDQLEMILQREVVKVDGDFAWISPTLDYCESKYITDPRQVISICMCGREMLVTGEYQKMLEDTSEENPTDWTDWSAA